MWMADLLSGASEDQFDAFEKVLAAAKAMEGRPNWGASPEHTAMKRLMKTSSGCWKERLGRYTARPQKGILNS